MQLYSGDHFALHASGSTCEDRREGRRLCFSIEMQAQLAVFILLGGAARLSANTRQPKAVVPMLGLIPRVILLARSRLGALELRPKPLT